MYYVQKRSGIIQKIVKNNTKIKENSILTSQRTLLSGARSGTCKSSTHQYTGSRTNVLLVKYGFRTGIYEQILDISTV